MNPALCCFSNSPWFPSFPYLLVFIPSVTCYYFLLNEETFLAESNRGKGTAAWDSLFYSRNQRLRIKSLASQGWDGGSCSWRDRVGDLVRNLDRVQIVYAFGLFLVSKKLSNYLKTQELYDWICVLENLWQCGGWIGERVGWSLGHQLNWYFSTI